MLKSQVLRYFGAPDPGAAKKTADALKITKGAVSQWGEVVPEKQAYKLEKITNGALSVDPRLYDSNSVEKAS